MGAVANMRPELYKGIVAGVPFAGLLTALYAVLYILLSLEAYSLLIGSLMLFAALAAVMYVTRNLDWGARRAAEAVSQ